MNTPDMVIFHVPDLLEFAAGGKTVAVHRTKEARRFFTHLTKQAKDDRPEWIIRAFQQFEDNPMQTISPAGEPAGFIRNEEIQL
ncbi:MAG: hypothetical protein QM488_18430 [Rhizobiaceae bacterium]